MPVDPAVTAAAFRERRKAARTHSPAGQMPSNWNELSNAQRGAFTQTERQQLLDSDFLWAPDAEEHGVWNTYNNYFCRCPKCSEHNAQRKASDRKPHDPASSGAGF